MTRLRLLDLVTDAALSRNATNAQLFVHGRKTPERMPLSMEAVLDGEMDCLREKGRGEAGTDGRHDVAVDRDEQHPARSTTKTHCARSVCA
jgi:hypothetical protein